MKKYEEQQVVIALNKKSFCQVESYSKTIVVKSAKGDLGIGSWGKIDFLRNYYGYTVVRNSEDFA